MIFPSARLWALRKISPAGPLAFKISAGGEGAVLLDRRLWAAPVLTPTAVFEPFCWLAPRCRVPSFTMKISIRQLGVGLGGYHPAVRKAGDIIPKLVSVGKKYAEGGHVFEMPDACPSCGAGTRLEEEAALRCTNPECPAQALRNLVHFASRGAMDIDGMGRCCAPAGGKGFVHNAADVYSLEKASFEAG